MHLLSTRRRVASRRRPLLAGAASLLLAVTLVAGCSSGSLGGDVTVTSTAGQPSPSADGSSAAAPTTSSSAQPAAQIASSPAFGSTGVSPAEPITVSVTDGKITDLTMTNPDGKVVAGAIAADGASWSVGEPLGFGKEYTVAGTATGADGRQVPISGTYTTVGTDTQVRNTIRPTDDEQVGVAVPISISFGAEPQDRAAIQKLVSITTEPAVEGAWAWLKLDDGRWAMVYRTKDYWPAGTKVHVEAKLYGAKLTDDAYGASDITSDFTIGRNQVVVADVNSKEMIVKQDGNVVASYPASYGRGVGPDGQPDPNLITRSGTHVVMSKDAEYLMNNPRYGYTNSLQRWAVRISNNGEFIHSNPNSVDAQGNTNVTHGCINLSLENGEKYFNTALYGDPVEISGTDVQLGPEDGDWYLWAMPWDQWKAMSVPTT